MKRISQIQIAVVAGSLGLALLFVLAPGVDLWFSGLFFRENAGFYLRDAVWVGVLYDMVHPLAAVLVVVLLLVLVHNLLRRRALGPFNVRGVLFMLAVLAVGPGLTVNVVFKDHWGRARPRDVEEFGGTRTFTPAFVISDQCERNCSFVSGHASLPFALAGLGYLLRRRRWAVYAGAAAFGGAVGLGRIIQGAHFLSDVVFSGVFVFLVAYLLAHFAFRLPFVGAAATVEREDVN